MINIFRKIKEYFTTSEEEKNRIKFVLKICKEARNLYVYNKREPMGMCRCFVIVLCRYYRIPPSLDEVKKLIQEFRRETFNVSSNGSSYWWPLSDRGSRIKAFNKLIIIYEQKLKDIL